MCRLSHAAVLVTILCLLGGVLPFDPGAGRAAPAHMFPASSLVGTVTAFATCAQGSAPAYVATSTGLYRSDLPHVYATWKRLSTRSDIAALAIDGCGTGHLFMGTRSGIFHSLNGGASWTQAATGVEVTSMTVVQSKTSPTGRVALAAVTALDGDAIERSRDGGASWQTVYMAPPSSPGVSSINALAAGSTPNGRVAAAVGVYHGGFLIQSDDAGGTWRTLSAPPGITLEQPVALALDPASSAGIWAAWALMGSGQLFHSMDGGQTWQQRPLPAGSSSLQVTSLAFGGGANLPLFAAASNGSGIRLFVCRAGQTAFSDAAPHITGIGSSVALSGSGSFLFTWGGAVSFAVYGVTSGIVGRQITVQVDSGSIPPALVKLYAASTDGSLYAFDGRSGVPLWAFPTGAPVTVTAPAARFGMVYFGSPANGNVYGVDTRTGTAVWTFHTHGAVTGVAVAGNLVVACSRDQHAYALDAVSGASRWSLSLHDFPNGLAIAGRLAIFGAQDSLVRAVDTRTGVLAWQTGLGKGFSVYMIRATGGQAFVASYTGQVAALGATSGKVAWRFTSRFTPTAAQIVPGVAAIGSITGTAVYVGSADHSIYALDIRNGSVLWRFSSAATVQSAPVAANGTVYAGNWAGTVLALNASTGSVRWKLAEGAAIYSSPAVADGKVYVAFSDQSFDALDASSGKVVWQSGISATNATPVVTTPADPAAPSGAARYFTQTGHNLTAPFLAFWQRNGGLAEFGYPLTEAYTEDGQIWQYFERFALVAANGHVSTVPLGSRLTQGRHFPTARATPSSPTSRFFPATGYTVSGAFLTFWNSHHGALLLGNPISPVITEGNGDGTGRRYPLQWFQRGRLEYHSDLAGTPYAVELGLLGRQSLLQQEW